MTSGTHIFQPCIDDEIHLNPREYSLMMLQQPSRVRISTHKEKGRKTLDPPPIVQIHLPCLTEEAYLNQLQSPCLFMCANLTHPENDNDIYTPNHNALSGQIVSSLYKLRNDQNQVGGYFLFGDISVKVSGIFRLKMSLFELTSQGAVYLSSLFSKPFTVYSAKEYPGILEPTALSRLFYSQGAKLRLPKDYTHQSNNTRKRKLNNDDDVDDECDDTRIIKHRTPLDIPSCNIDHHTTINIGMERRQSMTSTENSGSPQSMYTPLSPLQELLPFSTKSNPMIILPPIKFELFGSVSSWQQDNDRNDDSILLPPLHSLHSSNSSLL
ncbi:velvet factor-domain-containing protein [Halteromyces radiatus]|uniref:velvet factor-domain-containing protein n=1 Tax=Halteromyces radiatus TaxID=101107 RepID=UPI0022202678|nr:velvet factor-domain-containing protein [Halteromyces radiatus]KAI8093082.1 velvet factor-domain-containing protein [Halteromyces radiatus]